MKSNSLTVNTTLFLLMMVLAMLIGGAPVLGGYLLSINISSIYLYGAGLPIVIALTLLFIRIGNYLPTRHDMG